MANDNTNDEKIFSTDDAVFSSAGGGTVRPGGENKGRKSNEYWNEVEKELQRVAKELNKEKAKFPKFNDPKKGHELGPRL